jgi:hypothetical protein
MATIEVSRTLLKSPPELWEELEGDRLAEVVGAVAVRPTEHERELAWEAVGARGTAVLEPAGWGTRVTLTAALEEAVAGFGVWARLRARPTPAPPANPHADLEQRFEALLEHLGAAHRKPFARE